MEAMGMEMKPATHTVDNERLFVLVFGGFQVWRPSPVSTPSTQAIVKMAHQNYDYF